MRNFKSLYSESPIPCYQLIRVSIIRIQLETIDGDTGAKRILTQGTICKGNLLANELTGELK